MHGPWDFGKFFRKNQHFFGHMIHQIYVEFPQDHEYAIQKILRPILPEL